MSALQREQNCALLIKEHSRYNVFMSTVFIESLLRWFRSHGRDLPWRKTRDPYAIWISEIMLQQTRVDTVLGYYQRWMDRFPDVVALAGAPIEDVLHLWEGLGYYQRAHRLHKAAQLLVAEYDGRFPWEPEVLEALPGIGAYTASAIASMAFDVDRIALDGNLRRVLTRIFDFDQDPRSSEMQGALLKQAYELMPSGSASLFNQALMDLGAMICTPRKPACMACPVAQFCQAYQRGVQENRPIRVPQRTIPHHLVAAGVTFQNGRVFIARRPEGGLLGGLWEFPGGKCKSHESLQSCLKREWREELGVDIKPGKALGSYRHAYTHFRVTVYAFECEMLSNQPKALEHEEVRWARLEDLGNYPMGKVDRQIAKSLQLARGLA